MPPRTRKARAVDAGSTVIHADCMAALAEMPPASVDCIVVDPPYGEITRLWDKPVQGWPRLAARVLKPSGSMWLFCSARSLLCIAPEMAEWEFVQDIVWEKHNGSGLHNDRFRRVHELVTHWRLKGSRWSGVFKSAPTVPAPDLRPTRRHKRPPSHWRLKPQEEEHFASPDGCKRLKRSVLKVRSMHGRATHPTEKPEDLLDHLLAYSCPVGGVVLDPFAGSGSTGASAKRLGMSFIGIESDAHHHATAVARLRTDART